MSRTHGYVPSPTYDGGEVRPHYAALLGNPYREDANTRHVPVALGAADELNRTSIWDWALVDQGDGERPEHWSHFIGHAVRVGVTLRQWNEREVNDWKGRDEIRPTGGFEITFNDEVVYGDIAGRDALETLRRIERLIMKLRRLPFDWRQTPYSEQIVGRRVYYHDTPAVIDRWMADQGCIGLTPVGVPEFPPRAWKTDGDDEPLSDENDWIKDTILSPHIWWHRRSPFGDETAEEPGG